MPDMQLGQNRDTLDLYFKFRTACFLSSIQNSPLKYFLDSIFSTISSYASLLKKPLKESSTISPKWKFTWLSQITTNQASSKKELQKLFTKEWEDQWEEKKRRSYPGWQTFCQKPHKNNLKLYKELQKAEASLLLQIRMLRPRDGSHSFIGNQAAGQARGHHGSQVTNQQGVT